MGEIIIKTEIKREDGFLYYCGTKDGNITVCKTQMARGRKKSKKKK